MRCVDVAAYMSAAPASRPVKNDDVVDIALKKNPTTNCECERDAADRFSTT
jgi:hypothetical protein